MAGALLGLGREMLIRGGEMIKNPRIYAQRTCIRATGMGALHLYAVAYLFPKGWWRDY